MPNRIGTEVTAVAHATCCAHMPLGDTPLKRVGITKRNEAVANLLRVNAHAASAWMKCCSLRFKRERARRSVGVARLRNDRANKQPSDIVRVIPSPRLSSYSGSPHSAPSL